MANDFGCSLLGQTLFFLTVVFLCLRFLFFISLPQFLFFFLLSLTFSLLERAPWSHSLPHPHMQVRERLRVALERVSVLEEELESSTQEVSSQAALSRRQPTPQHPKHTQPSCLWASVLGKPHHISPCSALHLFVCFFLY